MSSTETGAIFGNIVYESTGYAERSVVVLNDIHIDIMDYISPASCPDVQFRSMWAEFEWENKARACMFPLHGSFCDPLDPEGSLTSSPLCLACSARTSSPACSLDAVPSLACFVAVCAEASAFADLASLWEHSA